MTTPAPIRVLHLDDSALDAELIRERIVNDDPDSWHFVHVETREEFEAAVAQSRYDLVLTDYSVPGYDGVTALRLAHATDPDVPIIVVSGTLSEEDAVESLKAGATDYIFKQRLQRAAAAVRRALAESRERRRRRDAEAAARELSERFSLLAESSQDVFWMSSAAPGSTISFISPSVEHIWGQPPQVFYKDPGAWKKSIHPEDRARVAAAFEAWIEQRRERFDEEYRVVRPDGTMRWIHDTGTRLLGESGRVQQVSGVARDITERKEIDRALIEKEKLFRATFEQAAVGILFLDFEGRRVRFNRRYAEILGYDPDELTPEIAVTSPDEAAATRERREQLLRGEATITRRTKRYIRKDGGIIWCETTNSLVHDADDRPLYILAVIQDVNERIRAEERLRESESLFRSTVNAMVEGVTVHDSCNRIVAANPSVERITGLPAAQLIGRSVADPALLVLREDGTPLPPQERPSVVALRTGAVQRNAIAGLQRSDGTIRWLSVNAQPLWLTSAIAPDAVVTTYQDITESRAAAHALRESERRQRTLLSHLQGMAYRCRNDEHWTMEFVSDGCRRLLGIEPEDLTSGRIAYDSLIHPDDGESVRDEARAADAERRASVLEYRVRHARGEWIWVLEKGTAVWDEQGELIGFEGFVSDISDRVRAEEEVRALNITLERRVAERTEDLQGANRELEAFSYSVSHDLRTPLGAIRGFADALMESCGARLDPADRHYLERIRAGGARMDALIDDMLSLSRISRADLVAVEVDVSALALEVLAEMREREPGRRSRCNVQRGMRARADTALLRIALTNLIGNAWKFSAGREEIVVEVGRLRDDGLTTTFFVRDEGAGFDPAYAEKLFGTFQRLHSQSEFPGTGIGLATVRRVIERHGGNVWAEGAVDEGATFYFSLPKGPMGGADPSGQT